MIPFVQRHLGSDQRGIDAMLKTIGYDSLDALIEATVPAAIRSALPPDQLPAAATEPAALAELKGMMAGNKIARSHIGMGYSDCFMPPVIQRNILENPNWYTAYTPYQAEISQGRLETLLNYQTMIIDLTGMEIANASLLDEATAAAEAMAFCRRMHADDASNTFFVSETCHPQTIAVVRTWAQSIGVQLVIGDHKQFSVTDDVFGLLLQYPGTTGAIYDYRSLIDAAHQHQAFVAVAADLLALTLITPPGAFGADVVIGTTQRFGVPLGYGGPHAAYFATRDAYKRQMPGRLIGVSQDAQGRRALRMALQTREQHIRREKATSNICTAQVLLAVIASMYAVYHGPRGLRQIAQRVHDLTRRLASRCDRVGDEPFFDTIRIRPRAGVAVARGEPGRNVIGITIARDAKTDGARAGLNPNATLINVRDYGDGTLGIALDETSREADVDQLITLFGGSSSGTETRSPSDPQFSTRTGVSFARTSDYLTHAVFNRYHNEHEMLRYLHRLVSRDLSLTTSMIPLGSCTMKLNATAEMLPLTWPEVGQLHPFSPRDQTAGYRRLIEDLESWLAVITGFDAVSLQPNAGSAGEYAGLLTIRGYHRHRGDTARNVCLIPVSAHGTNPASAAMAGFEVVVVACDEHGNINVADLGAKAEKHAANLGALMVTYPSTHGVFEAGIKDICRIVHDHGGQVYMDGANMNAQIGLCRPGDIGADVCHLNLHKTFCIPHGGGGPGMGPICVARHLAPFLPGHPLLEDAQTTAQGKPVNSLARPTPGPVAAAPYGSASILVIPWMYIRLMGAAGLTAATKVAILNANYIARRLNEYFPVLYRGPGGMVAHECILDLRTWKTRAGIEVEDVAKRLIDYGFHAPTMSWPVPGTLMVEPTESESKAEIDRFCDAMIAIHAELAAIENGTADRGSNALKHAPHTAQVVSADTWDRAYSREQAAYPAPWLRESKFWPAVGRVDNVYGDRNLMCSCPPLDAYAP